MTVSAARDLFALALEYYRAPLDQRFSVDVNQPVPEGLSRLLSDLGRSQGDNNEIAAIAQSLKVSPAELGKAAFFYLKQLLFSADCDHYRLLGLARGVSAEEIRNRYRQLIRLFHPDRNPEGDAWDQLYAPRINTAYNVLKSPHKREEYDRQLTREQPGAQQAPQRQPAPKRARRKPAPQVRVPMGEWLYRSRLLQRHPKIMVWGAALLILSLLLLYAAGSSRTPMLAERDPYAAEEPVPYAGQNTAAPGSGIQSMMGNLDQAGLMLPRVGEVYSLESAVGQGTGMSSKAETGQQPMAEGLTGEEAPLSSYKKEQAPAAPEVAVVPQAAAKPVVKESPAEETIQPAPAIEKQSLGARTAVIASKSVKPPAMVQVTEKPPAEEVIVHSETAHLPEKALTGFDGLPVRPDSAASTVGVRPGQNLRLPPGMQPEMLLLNYVSYFEAGELNKLLDLFTEAVVSNEGRGRDLLARRYAELFRNSAQRKMTISQLNLAPAYGRDVLLMTRVSVAIKPVGEGNWQRYAGDLVLAVTRQGRQQYISRFTHNVVETGQDEGISVE